MLALGLYLPELPQALSSLSQWESRLGSCIEFVSIYQAWRSPYSTFYSREIGEIHESGRRAVITWEPWAIPVANKPPQDQVTFSLKRILAGSYDEYIWHWAVQSARLGLNYLLRPMHEMNGNWYPWCGTVNDNEPDEYINSWRYLHNIFQAAGATRVCWVWSPYTFSYPMWPKNAISCYYPGDSYVDWIALDGYNWGDSQPWSRWQTFEDTFSQGYETVTALTDKPLLIAEVGSAESGGDKSVWITSAFEALRHSFSRVKGLIWFNVNKECDWRINSSVESMLAFRKGLQSCVAGTRR